MKYLLALRWGLYKIWANTIRSGRFPTPALVKYYWRKGTRSYIC